MTDPGMADVTYIEPLNLQALTEIIENEKPDAILPNLAGRPDLILLRNFTAKVFKKNMV